MEIDLKDVINKIERYCVSRERCASEIRERLVKYYPEIGEDEIEDILFHLKNTNFWNEERFASAFVHDKHEFNAWGPIKIRFALKNKQVDERIIYEAMQRIDDEKYIDMLYGLLQRKYKLTSYEDEMDARVKLSQYAQSKGYPYDMINVALARLFRA